MNPHKPYHHGNLRADLLQAAVRLIAEVGPTAFTLREVARRAGVSHNAPYRHFQDRDDLLGAVAGEGFRQLNEAMVTAAAQESRSQDRLKVAGTAYVAFALRRPEHFAVMFDAPAPNGEDHGHQEAGKQAFDTLLSLVRACQDEGSLPEGSSADFALLAWTMVHGIAKLATTGRLPYRSNAEILKFARFVIDQSLPRPSQGGQGDRTPR
ncbi:MAG TPA: TetR/AcrR family transcriptional regulator [Terracidiphilus sp.]|jgi:AcrR family transcriptional regulator